MTTRGTLRGEVTSIRGTVVEMRFEGVLPAIGSGVVCRPSGRAPVTGEVYGHNDVGTARAIERGTTASISARP